MAKLALGPIRFRRIVLAIWAALLFLLGTRISPTTVLAAVACLVVCIRAALTRVEMGPEALVVVNLFKTTRLPLRSVERAGFAPGKWGYAVPLVLSGPDVCLRASGVSVWPRRLRWPDQPFVRAATSSGSSASSTGPESPSRQASHSADPPPKADGARLSLSSGRADARAQRAPTCPRCL